MSKVVLAQDFFDEVVQGLMLADLNNLVTKIAVIPNSGGNCNFPIVLFIFSCIEFLGYLTAEELIEGGQEYTKGRIFSYINLFFDEKYKVQLNAKENDFVDIFRHGLSHEFFAKAAGVSRQKEILIGTDAITNVLVLDADEFYKAFRLSTEVLRDKISSESGIAERIVDRYTNRLNDNKKKFGSNFTSANTPASIAGPTVAKPLKSVNDTGTASYTMSSEED